MLVDLSPNDFRVIGESEADPAKAAELLQPDAPRRRFDTPRFFEQAYGKKVKFADLEHRKYDEAKIVSFTPSDVLRVRSEFESVLNYVRDRSDAHPVFDRLIPDARKIVSNAEDPIEGIRDALVYRDPKTESTLVSAMYRFSLAPFGRRLRDLAFGLGIQPYDPRELAAAKIEGYCRHFRSYDGSGHVSDFESVKELCDKIARGAYADSDNRMGETLFTILVVQMANSRNYEWAARAMDVLLNELTDAYDPKADPIDAFRTDVPGRTVEARIRDMGSDERMTSCATTMFVKMRQFLADTARYGHSPESASPTPESIRRIRDSVERAYYRNSFDRFRGRNP